MQAQFNAMWGIFPFIHSACGGDMTKMKYIMEENLYDFLYWCSYEISLAKLKEAHQKEMDRMQKTHNG